MNNQLEKRLKALLWRAGMMTLGFLLAGFVEEILPLLTIAPEVKVVIGLILGEVSKYLNK